MPPPGDLAASTVAEMMDASPIDAAMWAREATRDLDLGPRVAWVYHPLNYAWRPHEAFLERYGRAPKKALLVGMNPGPWGMGQTGVPFGTVDIAGDWLGLRGIPVERPAQMHPKRPVDGWSCTRQEVSGQRLWGFLRDRLETPDRALRDVFVVNHCPLLMFDIDGRNVTPDKLLKAHREPVLATSDEAVARMAHATRANVLIGVGAYAADRCRQIVGHDAWDLDLEVDQIPHPSPASPLANKDGGSHWRAAVAAVLERHGVL